MKTSQLAATLLSIGLVTTVLFACSSHPGGTVGDPCDEVGSSNECEGSEICDDLGDGDGAYCLKRCVDHADCDPDERCNGISNSNDKGCHPASESTDDDGDGGKLK